MKSLFKAQMTFYFLCLCLCLLFMVQIQGQVYAQTQAKEEVQKNIQAERARDKEARILIEEIDKTIRSEFRNESFVQPNIPSLFFLPRENKALVTVRQGWDLNNQLQNEGTQQASTDEPLLDDGEEEEEIIRSIRTVSLNGILFTSNKDWIVWLNQEKITPKNIPEQIKSLKVAKDFVDVRWLDIQTQRVFPIRLRPNQTFNLDNKIFLPGTR